MLAADDRPSVKASRDREHVCVCVVTPNWPAVSESFIWAHVERLPARVVLIHGWPPQIDGVPILSLPGRALRKIVHVTAGGDSPTTAAYVKAFRQYGADVVLAEYGPMGVVVQAACERAAVPLVVHFHGYDATVRAVIEEHATTYPAMFRTAAGLISVSRAMHRQLIALGASPERLHYNPCGVDCQEFLGANPSTAPPIFVAVGRFVDKKAPQLTLQAFAAVHRQLPAAKLRMVGEGPLLEQCRRLVGELAVGNAVSFLGAQPHAVVREEMKRARCFVQHSIEAPSGDCEGTPVGILEAGASALPVVSTLHAGIPDVIVDGKTGFLVPERDVGAMADRMLRLAKDPELAQTLGRAGRERIEAHFSIQHSIEGLSKIIECCATGRDGPRE